MEGPPDPGSVSPRESFRELYYGTFPVSKQCDFRSGWDEDVRCLDQATWAVMQDSPPKFVCDRCLVESIRRLTSHGRQVLLSRLP